MWYSTIVICGIIMYWNNKKMDVCVMNVSMSALHIMVHVKVINFYVIRIC